MEVDSVDRSIEFYTTKLPFYLSGRDSSNHCWLTLHGSTAIDHHTGLEQALVHAYLRRKGFIGQGEQPPPTEGKRHGLIYIRMDGTAQTFENLYKTLKDKGLRISQDYMATPWGTLKFAIYDLDDNEICFYVANKPGSKA